MPFVDVLTVTYLDSGGEPGVVSFHRPRETAFADHLTNLQPFLVEMDNVLGGAIGQTQISRIIKNTPTLPASRQIQRNNKLSFTYKDVTEFFGTSPNQVGNNNYGVLFTKEFPCADLSVAGILNDDDQWTYDRTTQLPAIWDGIKTAFEAFVLSPSGGAVELVSVKYTNG